MIKLPLQPACLDKPDAAIYLSLSESSVEKLAREDETFPKPRELTTRRVGYLVEELDQWLKNRPIADHPPPPNSRKTRKKPA